jgi:uncharacterized membrane protein
MLPGGTDRSRARWLAAAAAALLYAGASHLLMTRAQDSAWSLAIVLGPLVALGCTALWRSGRRFAALLGIAAALLVGVRAAAGGVSPRWLYLAQHAGVHLALAASFGITLRPGAQPLISMLAERLHGGLTPALAAYTRQVTVTWVIYFLAMAATSLALFAIGDFALWSVLANLLTPIVTATMFVGEYLVRYRLHPEFERVTLQMCLRAYRAHGQDRDAPSTNAS